tara:strand:- start:67 stop:498 length:432 start_codon:yes stop_codon:yes gene_type:complete
MNNCLNNIQILLPEFNFFQQLSSSEKFLYLTEIYELETRKASENDIAENLQTFFEDVTKLEQYDVFNTGGVDFEKVDVLVDNENLVLESNSLSAVRQIKNRFIDEGYILTRDSEIEKMFKKNKLTRYLRVYKIIGRVFYLCYN